MSSQVCDSIDTLSMSYLDDELAAEEKRELELHLLECNTCRERLGEERQEVEMLRKQLALPATPELVRAKVTRLLDREDAQVSRALIKERVGRWLLPGASIATAVAALLVFVFLRTPDRALPFGRVVTSRAPAPLVARGEATTQSWLAQEIAGTVAPSLPGIELVGGNVTVNDEGRKAARLVYEVGTSGPRPIRLEAFLFRARPGEFEGGRQYEHQGRILHVSEVSGQPAVGYLDENGIGYVFLSRDLSESMLLELVCGSNLIDRARDAR